MSSTIGRFAKSHSDWLILTMVTIIGSTAYILGFILFQPGQDVPELKIHAPNTYAVEPKSDLYKIIPPDSKYPPPAKEQRSFYRTYTADDVEYDVVWLKNNVERKESIGPHTFRITMANTLNRKLAINSSTSLAIGCIAEDNPYRVVPVTPVSLSFEPYERKEVDLSIDISCLYIGTADKQYFWRIY